MKAFKDNADRTWVISINVYAVKKLRALLDVDLYGLVEDRFQALGELISDPVRLVDVIYVLCKDEADKLGITDEDFGRSMAGDVIEHASNAFLAELVDFFPDTRVRMGLTKVLDMSREVKNRMVDQALQEMDGINLDSIVKRLRESSGTLPEQSVLIPGLSTSVS